MSAVVLPPDVDRLVTAMLANAKVRQELSGITADALEFMAEAMVVTIPEMVSVGFSPDCGHGEVLIAGVLGWMLGFGVAHQDLDERRACLEERLAIVRRAAEQSARINAQIDLRRLN